MKILIATAILLSGLTTNVLAEDESMVWLEKIPPAVRHMAIVGTWKHNPDDVQKAGQVRLLVTKSEIRNFLYIQWLDGNKVVSTRGIDEVNKAQRFRITLPRVAPSQNPPEVHFTLEDLHTRLLFQGELSVMAPGKYYFGLLLKD